MRIKTFYSIKVNEINMTTKTLFASAILLFASFTYSQALKSKDYTLIINKVKVVKENKQTFWATPTTLFNNTKDTLKYFSMSCSWQDFYLVDNHKLKVEVIQCDKNIPIILTLAPGQSKTIIIRLLISQKMKPKTVKFKIGLNIMKVASLSNKLDLNEQRKKKNIIWSNIITI